MNNKKFEDLVVLVVRSEEEKEVLEGSNKGEMKEELGKEKKKQRQRAGGRGVGNEGPAARGAKGKEVAEKEGLENKSSHL